MTKKSKKQNSTTNKKPIHPRNLIIPVMIGVVVAMLLPAIGISVATSVAISLLVMGISFGAVLGIKEKRK